MVVNGTFRHNVVFIACECTFVAAAEPPPYRESIPPPPSPWWQAHWRQVAAVAVVAIIVLAAVAVLYVLSSPPSSTHYFEGLATYNGNLILFATSASLGGVAHGRFQIAINSSARVDCALSVAGKRVADGTCEKFTYVYKTKWSAEAELNVTFELSLLRNGTNAAFSVDVLGGVYLPLQTGGSIQEQMPERPMSLNTTLDDLGTGNIGNSHTISGILDSGQRKPYFFNVTGEAWVNLTVNLTVGYKIEVETTTVVSGDCHSISSFSWVNVTQSFHAELEVELSYDSAKATASVSYTLEVAGPDLTVG